MNKLKSDIRKAINTNTKYTTIKVWRPEIHENMAGEIWMTIEIEVRKRKN